MKLLVLTPQLPYPPRQGTTIRNFFLLKHLAARHRVDLLTFLAPDEQLTADNPLHQLCGRVAALPQPLRRSAQRALDTLRSPLPDMALRLEDAAMHRQVRSWLAGEQYDLVQIEGIEMAQYGLGITGGAGRPLVVFDDHNCEYLLQKRNALTDLRQPARWAAAGYSLIQWQKLLRYEAEVCRQAQLVLAVSTADQAALQAIAPEVAVTVIANGIEPEAYTPAPPPAPAPPFRLLFTGKLDYRPNIDAALWFGRTVLPQIQAVEPEVVFEIVGRNPHPRLATLRTNPAVTLTGEVPDVRPYLASATVCLIPMRVGGGTRLKALEAMAAGKAIVSTRLGIEGIPVTHGQELLLADTPADYAAAVLRLIDDARAGGALAGQLGQCARTLVETHYSWAQSWRGGRAASSARSASHPSLKSGGER
jgi:polysaccharide biosynthesis protein PslH